MIEVIDDGSEFNIKRDDAVWLIEGNIMSDLKVFFYKTTNHDIGWKLSIQGKDINDSIQLFDLFSLWCFQRKISYKIGTAKRYGVRNRNKRPSDREQSFKAMTVYCPNHIDVLNLAKEMHQILVENNYQGWDDVKTPTSYTLFADGVYYRNDRDENGGYIRAMPK